MNDGRLSLKQREQVAAYINGKAPLIGKCPTCGDRRWGLLDHFVHIPIFHNNGSFVVGGPSYPNIGLICQNCGNTQLINAVAAGIIMGDPVPTSNPPAGVKGE